MKTLFALILVLATSLSVVAQERTGTVTIASDLATFKSSAPHVVELTISGQNLSEAALHEKAAFYTSDFTISSINCSTGCDIEIKTLTAQGPFMVARLIAVLGLKTVAFSDQPVPVETLPGLLKN